MSKPQRRGWSWSLAAMVFATIAILAWWFMQDGSFVASTDPTSPVDEAAPTIQALLIEEAMEPLAPDDPFAPGEIINNPKCQMVTGYGQARDLAMAILYNPDGLRFALLDGTGTLFSNAIPFRANHFRIGRQADGTFVIGFADLRLNSAINREADAPEAMRIYQGNQIVYETDKTLQYGIARDGTSFYSIEPLAGGATHLKIRHFYLGTEVHIDIGDLYSDIYDHPVYGVWYTLDQTEIHFSQKSGDMGPSFPEGEKNLFYSTKGGELLVRTVNPKVFDDVVFESSRYGYTAQVNWDTSEVIVSKRKFHGDDTTMLEATELWSRTLDLYYFWGLTLADDGKWLLVSGWNQYILDTETGETVFAYPTDENLSRKISPELLGDGSSGMTPLGQAYREAEFERVKSLLPPDATVEDVGGRASSSLQFRDGLMMMPRHVRTDDGYRNAFDIYDMSDIQIDSPPKARVIIDPGVRCAPGDLPGWGLQEVDGKLTYLTKRLAFDPD